MAYDVKFGDGVVKELDALRAFDSKRIVKEIQAQLKHDPLTPAKNRKCLDDVEPDFEHRLPIWELRVGEYRVFYDVDIDANIVWIRAIRRKKPKDRTEDIIQ